MKKQYYISEVSSFRYQIALYHDGVEIDTIKKWFGDELNEYLDYIESQDYTRGYSKAEIDTAEAKFKHLRDNWIEGL